MARAVHTFNNVEWKHARAELMFISLMSTQEDADVITNNLNR